MSKELVDYSFVAMTYKRAKKTSEFNDKRWVKLKCKTNWTNIILLVHVVVISVQVGLLYEFFFAII
jgi:high-affinity Fe2+/Pb2+ permease